MNDSRTDVSKLRGAGRTILAVFIVEVIAIAIIFL